MTTRTLGQKQEAAARAAAVAAKEKEAAARAAKEKEAAVRAAKTKEHSAPGPSTGNTNSPGGKQARKSTTPRSSPRGSPAGKQAKPRSSPRRSPGGKEALQTQSLRSSPSGSQGSTKSPARSNKRAKVTASTNGDPNVEFIFENPEHEKNGGVNDVNAAVLKERDGVDAVYAGVLAEVRPEVPALVEGSTKVRALDKDSSKESSGTAEEKDESSDDQNDDFAEPSRVHKKKTATANANGRKDDQSSTDDDEVLPTPVKKASDIDRAKRGRKFKTDSPAGLL